MDTRGAGEGYKTDIGNIRQHLATEGYSLILFETGPNTRLQGKAILFTNTIVIHYPTGVDRKLLLAAILHERGHLLARDSYSAWKRSIVIRLRQEVAAWNRTRQDYQEITGYDWSEQLEQYATGCIKRYQNGPDVLKT